MKHLLTALVVVLLIAATVIGATVFVTTKFNGVVTAFNEVGSKFDELINIFDEQKVNGITRQILNPANVINVNEYAFQSGIKRSGIDITYDDDGVINLDGKATIDYSICLGEYYILQDGYYTVNVIADEPARRITYIRIVASEDDSVILKKSFADPATFHSDKLQYVKVYLDISYGDEFNNYKIAPVLVEGKSMSTFYIDETIHF